MRRFFALPEQVTDRRITLAEDEAHHLRDVLRLGPGEQVNVFDGCGSEYVCTIASIARKTAELSILEKVLAPSPESPLDLTLPVAVLKGDKFDLIIQKLVELGAKRIIPLITKRTEADARGIGKRSPRWRRIALEATKQCGRARLTEISEARTFDELISAPPNGELYMFAERKGTSFSQLRPEGAVTAIIGPEGGWDDRELQNAERANVTVITLGGRILRAETAAISIAAVLQHRFGDLN